MFKGFKKLAAVAVLAAGFGGVAATNASAAEVTVGLDTLLPGGSNAGGLVVGDKRYSGFTFSSSGSTVLNPADVDVMIMSEGNRHDLAFLFDLNASNGQRSDLVIGYRLDAIGSGLIRRIDGMFDGGPFGAGDGRSAASMIETVSTVDGSDLAPGGPLQSTEILNLFNDGDTGLPDTQEFALDINPTRALLFVKDILVSSRPNAGLVGISVVQQGVEQTTVIPLPAAFWAAMPILGAIAGRKKLARLATR